MLAGVFEIQRLVTGLYNGFLGVQTFLIFFVLIGNGAGLGVGAGVGLGSSTITDFETFNKSIFFRLAGVSKTHRFVTGLYNGFLGVQTFFVFTPSVSFLTIFFTMGCLTDVSFTTLVFFTVFLSLMVTQRPVLGFLRFPLGHR